MGSVRGHLYTPTPDGERFVPEATLRWGEDGLLGGTDGSAPVELEGEVLLVPGFVDVHIHLPQLRVRGRFHEALLPWLREHIWPEEARFAEPSYRDSVVAEFRASLLAAGTTSAVIFGSPHADSAEALLDGLDPLNAQGGDVLMDRNSPEELVGEGRALLASSAALAERYGHRYWLTPRFVPTCTVALLEGLAAIAAETGAGIQSHVSENLDEVAWVKELHPEARSYLDVYDRAGLLGSRTILAHGIHLDDRDLERLAQSGTWIAHCPTSNEALGSGRMPYERHREAGVSIALATDVGAGPDVSMLDVMASFLAVQAEVDGVRPALALRLATLAGARAMGEARRGALVDGWHADLVALRIPGGLRRGETGEEALGRILETFAGRWDDAVAGVWAGGERVAPST